jgi:hypothetical protein
MRASTLTPWRRSHFGEINTTEAAMRRKPTPIMARRVPRPSRLPRKRCGQEASLDGDNLPGHLSFTSSGNIPNGSGVKTCLGRRRLCAFRKDHVHRELRGNVFGTTTSELCHVQTCE